jgi:hypothetical protein
MLKGSDKVKALRDAGVIYGRQLPREYRALVEGLTEDEVDVLVSVKRRLDEADECAGTKPPQRGRPPYTVYMTF